MALPSNRDLAGGSSKQIEHQPARELLASHFRHYDRGVSGPKATSAEVFKAGYCYLGALR